MKFIDYLLDDAIFTESQSGLSSLPSTTEGRAWLDPLQDSWTEVCIRVLEADNQIRDIGRTSWSFLLATLGPPSFRVSNNNVRLLGVHTVYALAVMMLRANSNDLEHYIFQLTWQTLHDEIVFYDHDVLELPQGAYVRLGKYSRPEENEACFLLQRTTTSRRTRDETALRATSYYSQSNRRERRLGSQC